MNWPWIVKFAWRDTRHSRRRLFLYLSSIIMGVAALVSIRSFGDNLVAAVETQSKSLLGADLQLRSSTPFEGDDEALFAELGGDQSRMTSFASMAFFPRQQGTRLVSVRALSGGFPYYGVFETVPAAAAEKFRSGRLALVDETLMLQFSAEVGDPIRIGAVTFEIAGRLRGIPGESAAASEFSPRVYIPGQYLEDTGLVQVGSRIRYSVYFRLAPTFDVEQFIQAREDELRELELSTETVEERKEEFSRELGNLTRFLGLIGFVALVLGGIGVASSIHLHIRRRKDTIAILRCVGATSRQGLAIFVLQAAMMGLLGALLGALLGLAVQQVVPLILEGILPFEVEPTISVPSLLQGLAIGLLSALLFASIPLVPLRRISPLLALRADFDPGQGARRDPAVMLLTGLVLLGLLTFSMANAASWQIGLGFFGGLVVVFGALFGTARLIMYSARRWFPSGWRYEWRQGLANLYRPQNQTVLLLLAVGLGTFFVMTIHLAQQSLLGQVELLGSEARPNLVFFDIQPSQLEGVENTIEQAGLPLLQQVPVVTMRIQAVNGEETSSLLEEDREGGERRRGRWALRREYRSTYRDHLTNAETLVEGRLQTRPSESLPKISVEERITQELELELGDRITFDILGVPVETEVGSIRRVEWRNFQPNFFVVFPPGVLEEAPQFHVLVTRAETPQASAALQRAVVTDYPNVSAIDLSLVLETVDSILDRVTFVVRFMALFSIVTGVLVLVATIASGRFQRVRECTLLRTLGASRRQIHRILLLEYSFLGLFAALTGVLLAVVAGWALAYFVLESEFVLDPTALGAAFVLVVCLTIAVGLTSSRGILNHPPLEVLRAEE